VARLSAFLVLRSTSKLLPARPNRTVAGGRCPIDLTRPGITAASLVRGDCGGETRTGRRRAGNVAVTLSNQNFRSDCR
jgi:hypothetical protein